MSTAKFDTLSNLAGTQTVPVATVAQGSAKAWVNFNGTGTVAIRASFNVSSITDNGTGNYTINFTTAMPDANYVASCTAQDTNTNMTNGVSATGVSFATSSCQVKCGAYSSGVFDPAVFCVAIFR